jgi:NADH-quinone oxidoreductase subunit B
MVLRKSLWPLPLHLVAVLNSWLQWLHIMIWHDLFRTCKFLPRQADMLMVMGTISKKWPYFTSGLRKCQEPRWVLQLVLVLPPGGIFDTYSSRNWQSNLVDVYVPGCPPRPEQIVMV